MPASEFDVVVERVGAAASGVQEHPEEPAVVARSPADVVEHDGPGQPLGFEDSFHQLHGDQVSLVGLGAGDHDVAVAFGPRVRVQEALGEIAGRQKVEQPELVLPAHAVGLEFGEQVEDGQVTAKLLAGGRGGEVERVFFVPVEGDAAVLDEPERVVDALVADGLGAIDQPGLIDLVLGEADRIEQARAEVAVDHAHRRIAEHQCQHSPAADALLDLVPPARSPRARWPPAPRSSSVG